MKKAIVLTLCLLGFPDSLRAEVPPSAVDTLSVQSEPAIEVTSQNMVLVNLVRTSLRAEESLRPALSDIQLQADSGGVLYIKGTVASKDEKKLIEDKVRVCPGVTEVRSEIQVV